MRLPRFFSSGRDAQPAAYSHPGRRASREKTWMDLRIGQHEHGQTKASEKSRTIRRRLSAKSLFSELQDPCGKLLVVLDRYWCPDAGNEVCDHGLLHRISA